MSDDPAPARGSLYNRYRPQRFDDLVGQEHVARALGNALDGGRPALGYLFSGSRGTGKTTTARILARCLNCLSSAVPTSTPCMECDSCRRIGHDDWLDVVEVDAASSARRIDEMREWLETVRYAPVASRYRVTIMDEAHQIQEGAASALLKTLEEPPPHLVVILCTTHPWDILPTIRSRLQHFALRKPGIANLVRVLERVSANERFEATAEALDLVARAADGSYRDALGLLDQLATYGDGTVQVADVLELFGAVEREEIFALADDLAAGNAAGAFGTLESTLDRGADPEQLIRGLVTHLRYLCLLQQGAHPSDDWAYSADELERLRGQANQLPPSRVIRGIDLIADAQIRIRHGQADPRIQLEIIAAKLAQPRYDDSVKALVARIEALERGGGAARAVPAHPAPAPVREASGTASEAPAEASPVPPVSSEAVDRHDDEAAGDPDEPAPPPHHAREPIVVDLDHLTRLWPQVVADLEQRHASLHGFLRESRVGSVEGETLTVMVSSVFVKMLEKPDERALVEQTLTELGGRPLAIRFEASVPAGPQERNVEDDRPMDQTSLTEELKRMFNATEE